MAAPKRSGSNKGTKQPHITDQPMTFSNWHMHIAWVNVIFVAVIPLVGLIMTYSTPLLWKTAVWALIYYFMAGLGITAGKSYILSREYYGIQ
jgi:stearoyl-CoA desaturase (delta-9 desaturase)